MFFAIDYHYAVFIGYHYTIFIGYDYAILIVSSFTRLSEERLNPCQKVSCDHFISIFISQAYLQGKCMTACNYWSMIALNLLLLLPAIVFVILKTSCRLPSGEQDKEIIVA